jgi:4-amino-4-deoxy-L-arabinose transferase-like glycosyltransferase
MQQSARTSRFAPARSILAKRYGPFSLGSWCLLVLIPLVLYTFNLGDARALTAHEILVAGPAKQMILDDLWLLPRIGDQFWVEKPPLPYWLAALSCRIAGTFTEANVRLPSAIAGVGVVLLVAALMARLFGETIGLLSGIVQATSTYMLAYARLAEADMLLLLILMAAISIFVFLQNPPEEYSPRLRKLWLLSFWGLIGLTNLVKGPLFGAVLTLLTCLGWLVVSYDWAKLKRVGSPTGVILATGIALAWPAWVVHEEPAALEIWNAHLFGRAAGTLGYTKPIWYYLTTWPTQLLPWTPLLLIGAGGSLRRAWHDRKSPDRLIWWWALSQLCLLSTSSGKHHHYLIYALPALSPVIAMGLRRTAELMVAGSHWSLNWGRFWIWGVAPTTIVAGYFAGRAAGNSQPDVWVLAAMLFAGAVAVGYFTIHRRPVRTLVSFATLVLLANLYVLGSVMPRRDPSAADKQFLLAVDRDLPPGARVIATSGGEISRHIFYLNRYVEGVWYPDEIQQVVKDETTFFAITRERNRDALDRVGRTTKLTQSTFTRREHDTTDRYTLFRVDVTPQIAAGAELSRQAEPSRQ